MQKKQWATDLHPSIWFINDFMKKVKNCNLWVYIQDCLLWQNIKLQDEFISNQTLHLFPSSSPVIDQTQNHFPNQSDEMDWSNQNWHLVTCIFLCLDALYYFISSSTWDTNCSSDCLLWFWLWNSKALKQMKLFDGIGSTNSYWQFIHAQLFKSCSWPHV